ncbi:hypothetical protein KDW98_09175 [Burkholderia vietnamiensis]|uniref:hypothetical protein n=1 Tax=Burkholderia vietnamiensis TaxID=60552 RepID=UPI001B8E7889|nr:hypothetical protein [Burkholderia vietnamiensis]MBR8161342.1 hypothetical protein [Burkholderia vietnamiensis]MCA8147869.1 hypothetical protein [Burkholderia vietnamiensis]
MADKQAAAWNELPVTDDPRDFLESVMMHSGISMEDRSEAATALLPYAHERLSTGDAEDDE